MTIIIGAGMAGLLAGKLLGRGNDPVRILEKQSDLPNNHSAVLRFRSNAIGEILGIPFKEVSVLKDYLPWLNPIADALSYSRKCTGVSRSDRSLNSIEAKVSKRYIAPPDLIELMAREQRIAYGAEVTREFVENPERTDPIISTTPMPLLMDILGYPNPPKFESIHGFNITSTLEDVDAYVSIYVPDPNFHFNRISLVGNQLIIEYSFPNAENFSEVKGIASTFYESIDGEVMGAISMLGLPSVYSNAKLKMQSYSKIIPTDDFVRRDFIHWATDRFGVYSLGRYATWRPGLLLDDLVNDVAVILSLMKSRYATAKYRVHKSHPVVRIVERRPFDYGEEK